MYRLVYLSDAVRPMTDLDLEELLASARSANERAGVTGLLVYADQRFLQVLEGPEEEVEAAYARTARSRRHTGLRRTDASSDGPRRFEGWAMGFERAAPRAVVEQLLEPLVAAGHLSGPEVRTVLLERFAALRTSAAR